MGTRHHGGWKQQIAMTALTAGAAVALVLGGASAASGDPYDNGDADTFTLTGTCDGVPTVVTHGPGATTTAFVDGRPTIARRLVFYTGDGVTVAFVHEDPSYPALDDRLDLVHCDLVLTPTGNRVEAWVQVPDETNAAPSDGG